MGSGRVGKNSLINVDVGTSAEHVICSIIETILCACTYSTNLFVVQVRHY